MFSIAVVVETYYITEKTQIGIGPSWWSTETAADCARVSRTREET